MSPEEIVSRLLYRDGLMLIIDKPAGFAVHQGPKGGASLEDCFDALRFGLPRMPALAHRLDKETSGCLVLGRHRKALADLNLLFSRARSARPTGRWSKAARRRTRAASTCRSAGSTRSRGWWMKHDPTALPSATTWKVMGRSDWADLARARAADRPDASVRVHCAEMGWPILGDNIYGTRAAQRRAAAASACPRDRGAALQEQAADQGHRAGAAAHAGAAAACGDGEGEPTSARARER